MIIDSPIVSGSFLSTGSLSQIGNAQITGSLTVSGSAISLVEGSFSGSGANLFGIPATGITGLNLSQIASGSVSASISPNLGLLINTSVSASNFTGSFTGSLEGIATSASYAAFALTSSYSLGGSGFPFSGSAVITGSLVVSGSGLTITGSVAISTLTTGSGVRYVIADADGLISAQTASAAIFTTQQTIATAGQTVFPITNGYSTGYVTVFVNGTKLNEDEFTDTSGTNIVFATGSMDLDVVEFQKYLPASGVSNNTLRTQNYFVATEGQTTFNVNYTPGLVDLFYNGSKLENTEYTAANGTSITLATASAVGDKLEVDVYSYQVGAFSGIGGSGVARELAFYNTSNSITGSNKVTYDGSTFSVTGSFLVTGSSTFTNIGPAVFSGSVTAVGGFSGSFSGTADNATSASYAYTASSAINAFTASKAISSSYADTASFANDFTVIGNLTVFGTQSVQYITSSQLNVSDNVITVNVASPGVRFGGLSVFDSGSLSSEATASLFWDSQNNHWIYQRESGSTYTGGMLISGPRNSAGLGNELGTTNNSLMKGQGGDHITSSAIFEVSGSVTMGTAITNSHAITGSFNITGSAIVNGVFIFTGSGGVYANIKSVGGADAAIYYNDGTNTAYTGLNVGSAPNKFVIYHAGAVRLAVDTNGNVGIGTITPASKLSVNGTIESSDSITIAKAKSGTGVESFNLLTLQLTGTGAVGDNANIRFTSAQGGYTIANISGIAGADNVAYGSLAFSTRNYNTDSVVEIMRLGNRGNVGIGTTTPNPAYKLDVSGDIRATGTIYANANGTMYFRGGDDAGLYDVNIANTMGIYGVQDSTVGTIKLGSSGGTLSGYSGRIGVNVTTPDQALHVVDTTNDTVMKLGGGGASRDTNFTMYSQSAGNTVQAIHYNGQMAFYSGKFVINSNGSASLTGALTQNTSDIRLKTNIAIIENALDKIKQLSGFTYNWNALANELGGFDTNIREVGVAAQSIKDVVPEAVFPAPFDNGFDPTTQSFYSKSGENYLTVQYEKLVPLLIEGIKEQNVLIQELQEKLQRNNIN
jgi:hypothetical protein